MGVAAATKARSRVANGESYCLFLCTWHQKQKEVEIRQNIFGLHVEGLSHLLRSPKINFPFLTQPTNASIMSLNLCRATTPLQFFRTSARQAPVLSRGLATNVDRPADAPEATDEEQEVLVSRLRWTEAVRASANAELHRESC